MVSAHIWLAKNKASLVLCFAIIGCAATIRTCRSDDKPIVIDAGSETGWRHAAERHCLSLWNQRGACLAAIRDEHSKVTGHCRVTDATGQVHNIRVSGYETHLICGSVHSVQYVPYLHTAVVTCSPEDRSTAEEFMQLASIAVRDCGPGWKPLGVPGIVIVNQEASEVLRMWDCPLARASNLVTRWDHFGAREIAFAAMEIVVGGARSLSPASFDWCDAMARWRVSQELLSRQGRRWSDGAQISLLLSTLYRQTLWQRAEWSSARRRTPAAEASFSDRIAVHKMRYLASRIAGLRQCASPVVPMDPLVSVVLTDKTQQFVANSLRQSRAADIEELLATEVPVEGDRLAVPWDDGLEDEAGATESLRFATKFASFIEDCGCKGKKMGGLARLADVMQVSKTPLVAIGNMVARPGSQRYSHHGSKFIGNEIERMCAALVPGVHDLLAISRGALIDGLVDGTLPIALANVKARTPGMPRFIDRVPVSIAGHVTETSVIGVFDPSQCNNLCDIADLSHHFEWQDIKIALERVLVSTPEGPVIICGNWVPDAEWLSSIRPNAVVVVDDYRRLLYRGHADAGGGTGLQAWRIADSTVLACDAFQYGYNAMCLRPDGSVSSWTTVRLSGDVEDAEVRSRVRTALEASDLYGQAPDVVMEEHKMRLMQGQQYVGAQSCMPCHREQYAQWSSSRHSRSMETLERVQRHRVQSCAVCHVTGGPPTVQSDTHIEGDLLRVGCEVCHGPGSSHIASPRQRNIDTPRDQAMCIACHNAEHSLMGMHGDTYWRLMQSLCRSK